MRTPALFAILLSAGLAASCNMSLSNGTATTDLAELEAKAAAYAPAPTTSSGSSGSSSSGSSSSGSSSSGSSSGGGSSTASSGGFLWKPVSDSNGNLVVLLPSAYKNVMTITVSGAVTESSNRSAIANGDRPHYRFSRPGAAFGTNIKVSGGGATWTVADGSKRTSL